MIGGNYFKFTCKKCSKESIAYQPETERIEEFVVKCSHCNKENIVLNSKRPAKEEVLLKLDGSNSYQVSGTYLYSLRIMGNG